MSAYLLALIDVTDPETQRAYMAKSTGVVEQFGGRFIVRGGNPEALEGEPPSTRVVLVEFPDKAAIRRFYHSPEYQEILPVRLKSCSGSVTVLEGT